MPTVHIENLTINQGERPDPAKRLVRLPNFLMSHPEFISGLYQELFRDDRHPHIEPKDVLTDKELVEMLKADFYDTAYDGGPVPENELYFHVGSFVGMILREAYS